MIIGKRYLLISFLIKLSAAIASVVVAAAWLKFLIPFISEIIEIAPVISGAFVAGTSYVRSVGEGELAIGDAVQFALDGVVVNGFFVPVAISKLHVVCNGIGKALFLFSIFFFQRLVDYHLQVFAKMCVPGMSFRVRQRLGFCPQRFPGRDRVWRFNVEFKIGNEEQVVP
jgi:hypothetical protein